MRDTARPPHLAPLWLSGSVRRWHCNPALSNSHQTNADHQGRCVQLLLALVDQLDAHCWCLTAAPLEYRRWSAGWTLAAHDLLRRAETLGCRQAVEEILIDLQPGADQ